MVVITVEGVDADAKLGIIAVVISVISLAVTIASARVNRRAAQISEWSASVGHAYSSAPPITVQLETVRYRWVQQGPRGSNPSADERIVLAEATRRGLYAEVVVEGTITASDRDVMLTFHDHARCGRTVWYSLENQSVFTLGSQRDLNRGALEAGASKTFTWVDRRSAREWAEIYTLHQRRNMWGDPELDLPRLNWRDFPQLAQMLWKHRMLDPRLAIQWVREGKVARSGFRIVGESRLERRVTVEWTAEVARSAIEAFGRDESSQVLLWRISRQKPGPIDDDVIRYRADLSYVLAAIVPPRWRRVPGRD